VQFVVYVDGSVRDGEILLGVSAGFDAEALRVIGLTRFEPGRQRGVAVPVRMSIPINFRLQ
jgi:periplasmic protein TonB